jgi:hypothetical protein
MILPHAHKEFSLDVPDLILVEWSPFSVTRLDSFLIFTAISVALKSSDCLQVSDSSVFVLFNSCEILMQLSSYWDRQFYAVL